MWVTQGCSYSFICRCAIAPYERAYKETLGVLDQFIKELEVGLPVWSRSGAQVELSLDRKKSVQR